MHNERLTAQQLLEITPRLDKTIIIYYNILYRANTN